MYVLPLKSYFELIPFSQTQVIVWYWGFLYSITISSLIELIFHFSSCGLMNVKMERLLSTLGNSDRTKWISEHRTLSSYWARNRQTIDYCQGISPDSRTINKLLFLSNLQFAMEWKVDSFFWGGDNSISILFLGLGAGLGHIRKSLMWTFLLICYLYLYNLLPSS